LELAEKYHPIVYQEIADILAGIENVKNGRALVGIAFV